MIRRLDANRCRRLDLYAVFGIQQQGTIRARHPVARHNGAPVAEVRDRFALVEVNLAPEDTGMAIAAGPIVVSV
jgi:hypothetical protein